MVVKADLVSGPAAHFKEGRDAQIAVGLVRAGRSWPGTRAGGPPITG